MGRRAVDLSAIGSKSRRATLLNYTRHFSSCRYVGGMTPLSVRLAPLGAPRSKPLTDSSFDSPTPPHLEINGVSPVLQLQVRRV